ncbi:hypothetical protein GCM10023238_18020 [Streptomyces heliomycini]
MQLGLLDARHIAGDLGLTTSLRTTVLADWRNQAPKRLPALRELCEERAERQATAVPPGTDPQEARGGLRDATALRAVAASWLADAPREGLADARRRLLDVRDALHLRPGVPRPLALQEQDQVAAELGVLDADALLRQVYEPRGSSPTPETSTWREVGRVLRSRAVRPDCAPSSAAGNRRPSAPRWPRGVVEQDGEVVARPRRAPRPRPVLPLRAAAAAAQAGLPSPRTPYGAWRPAPPLPAPWPAEAANSSSPCWARGVHHRGLEALEAEGLVSCCCPDWDRVRFARSARRAPVDRRTGTSSRPPVRASAFTHRRVGAPTCCWSRAAADDIGKGLPGDHSVAGESSPGTLAAASASTARRHGWSPPSYATTCCSSRPRHPARPGGPRHPCAASRPTPSAPGHPRSCCTPSPRRTPSRHRARPPGRPVRASPRRATWSKRVGAACCAVATPRHRARGTVPYRSEQERLAIRSRRHGRAGAVPAGPWPSRPPSRSGGPEPLGVELRIAVPDQAGVLPAVAGVLAMHRLTVRTAELRALDLPDGVDGSVLLLDWRVAAEYDALPCPRVARCSPRADLASAPSIGT